MKKLLALLLSGCVLLGLAACGSTGQTKSEEEVESAEGESAGEKHKIVVVSYDVTGDVYQSSTAYLDLLSEALNFEYEYVSAGYTSQEQLATVETYLAQGYRGVILNQDAGATEAILDLAEDYDAYVAGYWQNFAASLGAASDGGQAILGNPRFLGSSVDGKISCEALVTTMFNTIVKQDGHTKVGIVTMPTAWYPNQVTTGVDVFMELVNEYNAGEMAETNGVPVEVVQTGTDENGEPVYYEQMDGESMSVSPSFFTNNEMTACASIAATTFTYSALLDSKADIDLYTVGWENSFEEDFGDAGMIKSVSVSPIDTLIFPVVQILDALNGYSYPDAPASDEKIVETDGMDIIGDAGMEEFRKTLNYTHNAEDAYFSVDDVKQLMVTYNSDATYSDLVAAISSGNMTISAEQTRK